MKILKPVSKFEENRHIYNVEPSHLLAWYISLFSSLLVSFLSICHFQDTFCACAVTAKCFVLLSHQ